MLSDIKDLEINGSEVAFTIKAGALKTLLNLLEKHGLNGFDLEQDGLNLIVDYNTIHDIRYRQVKKDPDNFPALQDLERIDKTDSDLDPYFWVNGYDRVQPLTADDIVCEFEDLKDYLKEHKVECNR